MVRGMVVGAASLLFAVSLAVAQQKADPQQRGVKGQPIQRSVLLSFQQDAKRRSSGLSLLGIGSSYRSQRRGGEFLLRVGALFPVGDTEDSTEFIGELEWEFYRLNATRLSLLVGWTEVTHIPAPGLGEEDTSLIPILLNYKRLFSRGRNPWFITVGIGAIFADDPISVMDLDDDWSFWWQVGVGVEFSRRWFLEVRYMAGENPDDDALPSVFIGLRF